MSRDPHLEANDRDDVAALVRIAGRRRKAPRERADRVRTAARDAWRGELGRRARRRLVLRSALLAAAASLALVVGLRGSLRGSGASGSASAQVQVEALEGRVFAGSGNALAVGDALAVGSALSTAADGRAAIRVASGHSVRLDVDTEIHLLEGGVLVLDRGALYVDSGASGSPAGSLVVRTPLGVIEELGTQFEVRLAGDSLRLRLREGAAILHHGLGADEARAGTELMLTRRGAIERRETRLFGPEWEWISGVTPMLDLEGRTAREFLDWIARERGWRVAYEGEVVARMAGEIVLGGGAGGLSPGEALDAVLPACRLTYRVEDGVLHVASAPSSS